MDAAITYMLGLEFEMQNHTSLSTNAINLFSMFRIYSLEVIASSIWKSAGLPYRGCETKWCTRLCWTYHKLPSLKRWREPYRILFKMTNNGSTHYYYLSCGHGKSLGERSHRAFLICNRTSGLLLRTQSKIIILALRK